MPDSTKELRKAVADLIEQWENEGVPGREVLLRQAASLKQKAGCAGLWEAAPRMATATIDDGIGQGIDLIGRFADAAGIRVEFLGLLQPPARIAEKAASLGADLVGLTVLQLDSEPLLEEVARSLPKGALLIAGGPAFRLDLELAARTGVDFTAADVAAFMHFLLGYRPGEKVRL